jgi:hypothetical protein
MTFVFHETELRQSQDGREAFLESQAKRYDRSYVHPISLIKGLPSAVIVYGGLLSVYELLTLGFSKVC